MILLPNHTTPLDPIQLARTAKALGHPARIQILQFLLVQDHCMCGEICDHLPLAQSTVSQHLKVLKDAGLITGEISGVRVCYQVNRDALRGFAGDILSL